MSRYKVDVLFDGKWCCTEYTKSKDWAHEWFDFLAYKVQDKDIRLLQQDENGRWTIVLGERKVVKT